MNREGTKSRPPEPPEYSLRVAQLRQLARLTQPELGIRVGVKRGAVAQWEAGAREPMDASYKLLAGVAQRLGEPALADFFLSRIKGRAASAARARRREFLKRYSRWILARLNEADKGVLTDVESLTHMRVDEMVAHQYQRLVRSYGSLKGQDFIEEFLRLTFETEAAQALRGQKQGPQGSSRSAQRR
jgi:transcriptional regulator with XRE-family HTH domain